MSMQAEDSESELSSAQSSASGQDVPQDELPSVEEMMDQCSLESCSANTDDSDDDDMVFFDARESRHLWSHAHYMCIMPADLYLVGLSWQNPPLLSLYYPSGQHVLHSPAPRLMCGPEGIQNCKSGSRQQRLCKTRPVRKNWQMSI